MNLVSKKMHHSRTQAYFNNCLAAVDQALCDEFSSVTGGDFFAIVPQNSNERDVEAFQQGGVIKPSSRQKMNEWVLEEKDREPISLLVSSIVRHQVSGGARYAYIHEPYLGADDESPLVEGLVKVGKRYYKIIDVAEKSAQLAQEILNYTVSWGFTLLMHPSAVCLKPEDLVRESKFIAIGAYDGESYIYWEI